LPIDVPLPDDDVLGVFDTCPSEQKTKLLALRNLIFEVAAETSGVGRIEETLKWGQPSYLTADTKSGSTLRIGPYKGSDIRFALFVHCQTDLISTIKDHYGDTFTYEGKRALIFNANEDVPEVPLRHCISMTLAYHLNKKKLSRT